MPSAVFIVWLFFQLSTNCGFIPTKETGLLTSIYDKLQYHGWTRKLSIRISIATKVIREHIWGFPLPNQCPKDILCSFSYFEHSYITSLNLFWQNFSVCVLGKQNKTKSIINNKNLLENMCSYRVPSLPEKCFLEVNV